MKNKKTDVIMLKLKKNKLRNDKPFFKPWLFLLSLFNCKSSLHIKHFSGFCLLLLKLQLRAQRERGESAVLANLVS